MEIQFLRQEKEICFRSKALLFSFVFWTSPSLSSKAQTALNSFFSGATMLIFLKTEDIFIYITKFQNVPSCH